MFELCAQIAAENNYSKFAELVLELNDLIGGKKDRLDAASGPEFDIST
jgi:hypothetical protein